MPQIHPSHPPPKKKPVEAQAVIRVAGSRVTRGAEPSRARRERISRTETQRAPFHPEPLTLRTQRRTARKDPQGWAERAGSLTASPSSSRGPQQGHTSYPGGRQTHGGFCDGKRACRQQGNSQKAPGQPFPLPIAPTFGSHCPDTPRAVNAPKHPSPKL